jgi:hypothetical protein
MGNSNLKNQQPSQAPGQKSQNPNEKNRFTGNEGTSRKQSGGSQPSVNSSRN